MHLERCGGVYWLDYVGVCEVAQVFRRLANSNNGGRDTFGLTPKELEIVVGVVAAYGIREIAASLNILCLGRNLGTMGLSQSAPRKFDPAKFHRHVDSICLTSEMEIHSTFESNFIISDQPVAIELPDGRRRGQRCSHVPQTCRCHGPIDP